MLREYASRPSKVLACRISEEGALSKLVQDGKETGKFRYTEKNKGLALQLDFEAGGHEPAVGGYIIQQSKKDVCYCPEDVFNQKYSIQGMTIR